MNFKVEKKVENIKKMKINQNENQENFGFVNVLVDDPSELFDCVLKNIESIDIFIHQIKNVICLMEEILYSPPYEILFGRINIVKSFQLEKLKKSLLKNIDQSFYDGFGIDEFHI